MSNKYRYFFFFAFLIISILMTNKVIAKDSLMTCTYKSSDSKSLMKVTIYTNFSHLDTITFYKSKSIKHSEDVQNWGVSSNTAYGKSTFEEKQETDSDVNGNSTSEPIDCSDFEDKNGVNLISEIFSIMMIIAPILLIVFGSMDFVKATLTSDEQAIKKASTNFGKRAIAAILLFFLPFIINLILGLAYDAGIFGDMSDIPKSCINE